VSNVIDIFVLDEHSLPVDGKEVTISIDGIWQGGTLRGRTDDDGHVTFETSADYESSRPFSIKVDGQWFGPYRVGDGRFTVQLL